MTTALPAASDISRDGLEVLEPRDQLLRDLRTTEHGLSSREAARRLVQYGPNVLQRRGGVRWPREIARQLTHPLALLLWVAAVLSFAVGSQTVGIAVVLVIMLNAAFAFVQELQAERAVEALAQYMPQRVTALRDGEPAVIEATGLVPGDVVLLEEGERIAADMRLLSGAVEVDLSALTGESVPVARSAESADGVCSPAWRPGIWCSAARFARAAKRTRWSTRPACIPSWAGSRRCPSGSRRSPARLSGRCGEWRG